MEGYSFDGEADILCFRHARSEFNTGQEVFYKAQPHKKYQEFEADENFRKDVLENPKYIDSPLSQVGVDQCLKAKQNPQLKSVKVVLVSPMRRALQTANIVFGDLGIPIIVHPEISESFRYSCDISIPIEEKKLKYPHVDFQNMQDSKLFWQITSLSERNQPNVQKFLEDSKNSSLQQSQAQLCRLVGSKEISENNEEVRARVFKIKQTLKKYRQKYDKIAVVSHWWIVSYLLGQGYDSESFPTNIPNIENATPYWKSLSKMLLHK